LTKEPRDPGQQPHVAQVPGKRIARPFLLSLLSRQLMLLKPEGFKKQHPHSWLVWEPGTSLVPRSSEEGSSGLTQLPDSKGPAAPHEGDPLCYELAAPDDVDLRLKVGRAAECDIVINEMTVSREQFELHQVQGYWAVLNSAGSKTVVGVVEAPHKPIVVRDHSLIRAGNVRLTFYGPDTFVARVQSAADEPPPNS
jgi:hypothetical protein